MDASRYINKDFHAKEKKCQHNGSKSILEEPFYLDVTLLLQVAMIKMALKGVSSKHSGNHIVVPNFCLLS